MVCTRRALVRWHEGLVIATDQGLVRKTSLCLPVLALDDVARGSSARRQQHACAANANVWERSCRKGHPSSATMSPAAGWGSSEQGRRRNRAGSGAFARRHPCPFRTSPGTPAGSV